MSAQETTLRNECDTGATSISEVLLAWHDAHGRKHLPWQRQPTPYRVWVSEIMLQQTQVATAIPYFEAFMERFPHVAALSRAPVDEVLHSWSGLGYYARARNLHRAACLVIERHGGEVPDSFDALVALPGIGRSTAGAILALARGERHAILDGNAKRVLARHFGVEGFTATPAVNRRLWELAESCTPPERVSAYTQAIMDLGATVCVRKRPRCVACPLKGSCIARASGTQEMLPTPRPRKLRPTRRTCMLLAMRDAQWVFLERRPPHGIWGGLWSLPEFDSADAAIEWSLRTLGARESSCKRLAPLQHAFTHFDLEIEPLSIDCNDRPAAMEPDRFVWYNAAAPQSLGIAAPVKELIESAMRGPLTPTLSPEHGGEGARDSFPLPLAREGARDSFPLPLAGEGQGEGSP